MKAKLFIRSFQVVYYFPVALAISISTSFSKWDKHNAECIDNDKFTRIFTCTSFNMHYLLEFQLQNVRFIFILFHLSALSQYRQYCTNCSLVRLPHRSKIESENWYLQLNIGPEVYINNVCNMKATIFHGNIFDKRCFMMLKQH